MPSDATPPRRRRPRADRADVVAVIALGGVLGSLARYALNTLLPASSGGFPWATWLENVTGSLLLAVLMVLVLDVLPPGRYLRPFLGVGVLGGYTTFSAYTSEVRALVLGDHAATALAYLVSTLLACLLAAWLGLRGGRGLLAWARRAHGLR